MKLTDISRKEFSKFEVLGVGSEGMVYKYKGRAVKIFHDPKDMMNKYRKIILIKSLNFSFVPQPHRFISFNDKIVGYDMEYIHNGKNLLQYIENKPNEIKIKYLKMVENNLKQLHKKHITVVDCNLHNFLITDNHVKNIDTDNFKVGNIEADIYPDYIHPYYEEKITKKIDSNFDKFMMTINALELLTDDTLYKKLLENYNKNHDYLEYFVNNLKIDKELKEFIKMQISDSHKKEYLEDKLDLFIL